MADTKITALTAISTVDPAIDVLPIVDVSDTTMAASGTTKKITSNQILGAGGTATLASATITGDLTVDTSTLKVDSANNRVIVGHTSGSAPFQVTNAGAAGLELHPTGASSAPLIISYNRSGLTYTQLTIDASTIVHQLSGSTAMTLNSTGLGVGGSPQAKLFASTLNPTDGVVGYLQNLSTSSQTGAKTKYEVGNVGASGLGIPNGTTNALAFFVGGMTSSEERMRIDSSGNVGVGVTPSAWSTTFGLKATQVYNSALASNGTSGYLTNNAYYAGAGYTPTYINASSTPAQGIVFNSTGANDIQFLIGAAGTAGNTIAGFATAKMTLDASGRLLIGKTASALVTVGLEEAAAGYIQSTVTSDASLFCNRLATDGETIKFYRETVQVGNISVTTTATAYNTSSDYRLKESVAPLSGGLARVNALKPSIYKWKSDGSDGEGFIAHELAEVVPFAVTGEKDAVNADGSIKSQGIDMSRIVPILVAAIKELTAEVNALKNA